MSNENRKNNYKSPYRENITKERLLNLSTINANNPAYWFVQFYGNKVRLNVVTGIKGGNQDDERFSLVLELHHWYLFMQALEYVARNRVTEGKGYGVAVEVKRPGKGGDKVKVCELWCGRNNDDIIYLACIVHAKPKIKFTFEDDGYYLLRSSDNSPVTKVDCSEIMAKSYARLATDVMSTLSATEYVDSEERSKLRPGGKKSNNYNNNSNDNSSWEDDSFEF